MNGRVWIAAVAMAMALVYVSGCDTEKEGDAMQTPTPTGSGESSLTRYCCDESLSNCDPEPTKDCADDNEKPVINWE